MTCRAVLKKRLFGTEGEAEGEAEGVEGAEGVGDEGLAAVISTPEAPILTPPSKRGNGGNQSEKPAGNPSGNQSGNPMEIETGNQGNQSGNQGNSGNQSENQSENHGGNQGNGGNAGEEGTGGKGGARGYFMFLGDTVPSFYRRPHSSFDGLLTAIPCGTYGPECPN